MQIAVVCLTQEGIHLGRRLVVEAPKEGSSWHLYYPCKEENRVADMETAFTEPLKDLLTKLFSEYDALVCIMALGIVVRQLGPLMKNKLSDPGVVVIDELGKNVISVLSGHWGGGNQLTIDIAELISANPVITTATDVHGLPAIDMIAKKNKLIPEPMGMIKTVNAAILKGKKITIFADLDLETDEIELRPLNEFSEKQPEKQTEKRPEDTKEDNVSVLVTNKIMDENGATLFLRPQNIIAGIGCRKGVTKEEVASALRQAFAFGGVALTSLKNLATVDIKQHEEGILQCATELNVPVELYTVSELDEILCAKESMGLGFSPVVQKKIGVGGVCEPAAVRSAGKEARMIVPKTIYGRVTVALAEASLQ